MSFCTNYLSADLLEVAKNLLSVHEFLCEDTGDGKHGNPSVLELLGLDDSLLSGISGVPFERIPVVFSGFSILSQASPALEVLGLGAGLPLVDDGPTFNEGTEEDEDLTEFRELGIEQVKVADSGAIDANGVLEDLLGQEANGGKH